MSLTRPQARAAAAWLLFEFVPELTIITDVPGRQTLELGRAHALAERLERASRRKRTASAFMIRLPRQWVEWYAIANAAGVPHADRPAWLAFVAALNRRRGNPTMRRLRDEEIGQRLQAGSLGGRGLRRLKRRWNERTRPSEPIIARVKTVQAT